MNNLNQFQNDYKMNLLTYGSALTGQQVKPYSNLNLPTKSQTIQSVFGLIMGNMYGGGSMEEKQMRNRAIMEAYGVTSDQLYNFMNTSVGKNAMAMAASGYRPQMEAQSQPSTQYKTIFKKTIDASPKSYKGMGAGSAGMIAYEGGGLSAKTNWMLGNKVPDPNFSTSLTTGDAWKNINNYNNKQNISSSTSMSASNRAQSSSSPALSFGMYPRAPLPAPPSSVTMPTTQAGMDYYRQSFFDSLRA